VTDHRELQVVCELLERGGQAGLEAYSRLLTLEAPLACSDRPEDRQMLDALAGARSDAALYPQRALERLREAFDLSMAGTTAAGDPSDVSGQQARSQDSHGLEDVLDAFQELLLLPDQSAVLIALASVVANYADGDPVWPLLVGPPGCGKSEIVTGMVDAPKLWALSSLTPQTLLSGFERKDKPASLLLQIGTFGILAFKDLTTVLTMHREARAQIIGQLREVADGKTEKSFGNGLRLEWQGKLGFLAGVTPVIDEQHSFLAVMGERFCLFRMPPVSRTKLARRSLATRGHEPELRKRIRAHTGAFLTGFQNCGRLDLPERLHEPLVRLSDIVTRARTGVARDGYGREMLYLPEPEAPTRLTKQLAQLGAALLAIGVDETETLRLLRKVGWDSVPAVRTTLAKSLRHAQEPLTLAQIQEVTGLPDKTVARAAEDLVALKLATRTKVAGKWHLSQTQIALDYWISEHAPETSEGVDPTSASASTFEHIPPVTPTTPTYPPVQIDEHGTFQFPKHQLNGEAAIRHDIDALVAAGLARYREPDVSGEAR
jgi:hypothetical protein